MIVKPVILQGTVQNSQNMTNIKHGEDTKPMVSQANISQTNQKEVLHKSENVVRKDNADKEQHKFDAKEKSKNEYYSVKVKKKKKQDGEDDGKVIVKSKNNGNFDVKI